MAAVFLYASQNGTMRFTSSSFASRARASRRATSTLTVAATSRRLGNSLERKPISQNVGTGSRAHRSYSKRRWCPRQFGSYLTLVFKSLAIKPSKARNHCFRKLISQRDRCSIKTL